MLTNTIIKGCNCIEHVLCNIILDMELDYSMLFTDSWNIYIDSNSDLPLRDRLDVYQSGYYELFDNLSKYYGIEKNVHAWPDCFDDLQTLISNHKYICLRVKTSACSWLISIDGMEEYHYLLIDYVGDDGIYGYDYSSLEIKMLDFDNLNQNAIEILSFNKINETINIKDYISDLRNKLKRRLEIHTLSRNISLLEQTINNRALIDSELAYSDLIISPLLRKISYIGFGRQNFLYLYRNEIIPAQYDLKEEMDSLLELSKKWLFLNKLFTKYVFSKKEYELSKIKKYISDLKIEEDLLSKFILKIEEW